MFYDFRVAARDIAREYHLEGLFNGTPVTLYHGTTRVFHKFSLNYSRDELTDKFYGTGVFLTPSKLVAEKYAEANRNIGFPPSIVNDLKRRNPRAGELLDTLIEHGKDGWDIALKDFRTESGLLDLVGYQKALGGVDPNDVDTIAGYVIGSKIKPLGSDDENPFFQSTGAPSHIYDTLDSIGLNSDVYRPKIYTVSVRVSNTLIAKSQAAARSARKKGYEAVLYHGPDLVSGVPEVAVFDAKNARIKKVEVLR